MIALMKDDTAAIKTASISAVNVRSKPRGRTKLTVIGPEVDTLEMSRIDMTNDAAIDIKATAFRSLADTIPARSAATAPANGMVTQHIKRILSVISSPIKNKRSLRFVQEGFFAQKQDLYLCLFYYFTVENQ